MERIGRSTVPTIRTEEDLWRAGLRAGFLQAIGLAPSELQQPGKLAKIGLVSFLPAMLAAPGKALRQLRPEVCKERHVAKENLAD